MFFAFHTQIFYSKKDIYYILFNKQTIKYNLYIHSFYI